MNKKGKQLIDDNLLRRALQLEIEAVVPPAADKMWRTIETRLGHSSKPMKNVAPVWIRYTGLAAAACLLILFGGIGLIRVAQFTSPVTEYDDAAKFMIADEEEHVAAADPVVSESAAVDNRGVEAKMKTKPDILAERQNGETGTVAVAETDDKPADNQVTIAATTPAGSSIEADMPQWPETLGEGYFFSGEIVLPPVEEEPLKVALYSSSEHEILLVSLDAAEIDPLDFVKTIGLQMQFPISGFQYKDDYLFFVAGGYNGLVFQHDGRTSAILAPLRTINKEQLIGLAAPFR